MSYMSRRARQNLSTSFFHVIVQGINKEAIFKEDSYKKKYLKLIAERMQEYDLDILAYVIMNNHAHLLIHIEKIKKLSEFMKKVNEEFANYYNYKENRVGYVFRGRFLSESIYNQTYLLRCISYIHNNPVKAHMVGNCKEYKFSSYNNYLEKTGFVNDKVLELVFGTKQLDADKFEQIHNGISYYFSEYENRVDDNMKEIIAELQQRYNKDWQEMIKKIVIIQEIAVEIKERINISNYRLAKYLKISRYRLEQILSKKNFLQNRPVPNCKKVDISKNE